jgi:hypothetical protein
VSERRAEKRLIVVALHKSGTNLLARMLRAFGFATVGEGVEDSGQELLRSASGALNVEQLFQNFPPNTALFLHGLSYRQVPVPIAQVWAATHRPPILYHYRDPRGLLLSFVNYVVHKEATPTRWSVLIGDLLRNTAEEQRLHVAIECLSEYMNMFREMMWLLRHPRVCKTSFEEIVGPEGGGSAAAQLDAIRRVAELVGAQDVDFASVQQAMYDRSSRTYFKGDAGAWRTAYGARELEAFNERYGDVLKAYGYV